MTELSREARALMEQGSSDGPSAHDRERIKARLAAELGVGVFAAATAVTAAGAHAGVAEVAKSTSLWLKSVASFLALSGGAAAIYVGLATPASPERAPLASPPRAPIAAPSGEQAPSTVPAVAPATPEAAEAAAADATSVAREPVRKARRGRSLGATSRAVEAPAVESAARVEPSEASAAAGDVQAELALLARAQRALREGRAEQALAATQEHASRFASGALREERTAIEAIASCRLGRGSAAARAFLSAAPSSPLAARVRKECGIP